MTTPSSPDMSLSLPESSSASGRTDDAGKRPRVDKGRSMQHMADRSCQQAEPERATRACTSVSSQPLELSGPSGAPDCLCRWVRIPASESPPLPRPHLSSSSCWAAHRPTWRLAAVRAPVAGRCRTGGAGSAGRESLRLAREWSVRRSERARVRARASPNANRFLFGCACGCRQTATRSAVSTGKWSGKRKQRRAHGRRRRDCAAAATAATPHSATIRTQAAAALCTARQSQSVSQPVEWRVAQKAFVCFLPFFHHSLVFGTSVTHEFISLNHEAIDTTFVTSL